MRSLLAALLALVATTSFAQFRVPARQVEPVQSNFSVLTNAVYDSSYSNSLQSVLDGLDDQLAAYGLGGSGDLVVSTTATQGTQVVNYQTMTNQNYLTAAPATNTTTTTFTQELNFQDNVYLPDNKAVIFGTGNNASIYEAGDDLWVGGLTAADLWLSNFVEINIEDPVKVAETVFPSADSTYNFGKTNLYWANAYVDTYHGSGLTLTETSEPADPADGKMTLWFSNGTGAGNDGDVMIKKTVGGVTTTNTVDLTSL
jgi:hypothetical protein